LYAGEQRQRSRGSDAGSGGGGVAEAERERETDIAEDRTAEEDEEGRPEEGDRAKGGRGGAEERYENRIKEKEEKKRKREREREKMKKKEEFAWLTGGQIVGKNGVGSSRRDAASRRGGSPAWLRGSARSARRRTTMR